MKKIILPLILIISFGVYGQCDSNTLSSFTPNTANNTGSISAWTAMNAGNYDVFDGLNIGDSYTLSIGSSLSGPGTAFFTVRSTSDNSVITSGSTTVTFSAPSTSVEVHYYTDNSCSSTSGLIIINQQNISALKTIWNGNNDTDWSISSNWSNGVPTSSLDVEIPNVTNKPIIGTSVSAIAKNITIDALSSLSITSGGSLTVDGTITQNGTFTINSGASLIAKTSSSGNITYERNLATTNWYLVGSPVAGETISDMILNNSFAVGTSPNIGFAPYLNDGTVWSYLTSSSTGALTSGGGYSVKLASAGNLSFTGTMPVTDIGVSITSNTNSFNLVGNPYPSYIAANENADGTNNLLTINSSDLTENTLWFWDQSTNSYDQINQASAAFHIAPAQGFFVSSTGSNTFNFTEGMQSHQSTDTFQKSGNTSTRPEITIVLTDGTNTRDSDIYYIDGTTTGWDNGYDSTIFGGVSSSFNIYTHLVTDSQGQNIGIQSLPNGNLESMVVPIGVQATSGAQITIKASFKNLPSGISIYLEDKEAQTFTLLDSSSEYTKTLANDLNGIGRFYLHTSSESLNTNAFNLDDVSVYMLANTMRVVGVHKGTVKLNIYDILGKRVLSKFLQSTGLNDLDLSQLKKGIYIVNLDTDEGVLNKKILIE